MKKSPSCTRCLELEKKIIVLEKIIKNSFEYTQVYTGEEVYEILINNGVIN